jgi:3',5'-cyclic AMP phosphodiesterase CpdA
LSFHVKIQDLTPFLRLAACAITLTTWGCGGGAPGAPATPPGGLTRIARGPYLQHADDGVAVAWYTDAPGEGRVRWYSEAGEAGDAVAAAGSRRREATLRGLEPGGAYTYRVYSSAGPLTTAGGDVEFALRAPDAEELRFVVFGDSGTGEPAQVAIARAIRNESRLPDLVLILGDVVYPPFDAQSYDAKFFAPFASLLPSVPFYALLGNHDYELLGGRAFLEVFSLPRNGPPGLVPETSYLLERAGAQLVVHDTNLSPATLRQHALPWHAQLARASASFRLVFEHHSLYSSGPNAERAPVPELRALLAPFYTATGVDVVFGGHEHFYERTRPIDGVVYVTSGAGGAALYPRTTTNPWSASLVNDRHGYTHVEVGRRNLKLRHMDSEGALVDSVTLTKAVSFADPLRVDGGGATAAPGGWTAAGFDDSSWSAALGAPGRLRARRAFWLESRAASDAVLRVRGVSDYQVWLNEAPVARGGLVGDAPQSFELDAKRLRTGRNVLAIEGFRGADATAAEVLELTLVSSGRR